MTSRSHDGEADAGRVNANRSKAADGVFATVRDLIESRQTVLPKRLVEPGPTADELQQLLGLAAAAPDHGQLTPWRFIVVPSDQRHRLANAFAGALAVVGRRGGQAQQLLQLVRGGTGFDQA
jgi:nitroreductase